MKLASVVGARPQFVKVWPVDRHIQRINRSRPTIEHCIIHTGQHYTPSLSGALFLELGIPQPTLNLGVGSGTHAAQTGRMLADLERALIDSRPDVVLVYGDTNSTLAAALAAVKLHVPLVHVEAGLRSCDRRMPEEINRVVADHVADLLLAPTEAAVQNLVREGLGARSEWTGDVMYDAWTTAQPLVRQQVAPLLTRLALQRGGFALATIHRANNVDETLNSIMDGLNKVAQSGLPILFPVHPRTAKALTALEGRRHVQLRLVEPVTYLELLCLVDAARVVLTDSGGLQKEAFAAGCPCVTLRSETEWVETVQQGGNVLAGADPDRIVGAVGEWERIMPPRAALASRAAECYGGGHAAERTLDAVMRLLEGRRTSKIPSAGPSGPR